MDEKDLFAAPSQEEQDLFAAPTDEEFKPIESQTSDPIERAALGGTTAGGIYVGQKAAGKLRSAIEALPDAAKKQAEELAFGAIGGTKTGSGRELLKRTLDSEILPEDAITPRSIGRRALDEDILGTFGYKSPESALETIRPLKGKSIKETDKLLEQVKKWKKLKDIVRRYERLLEKQFPDPAAKAFSRAAAAAEEMDKRLGGVRTASDLEDLKRLAQKEVNYAATDAAEKTGNILAQAEARALREGTESLLEPDQLKQFKNLKKTVGERGLIEDFLEGKAYQDALKKGDITLSDVAGGAKLGLARRAVMHSKGLSAKALDKLSQSLPAKAASGTAKALGKAADLPGVKQGLKALPLLGAGLTYGEAKAAGASDVEALGATAIDEITDLLGPAKMALTPGKLGVAEEEDVFHKRAKLLEKARDSGLLDQLRMQQDESVKAAPQTVKEDEYKKLHTINSNEDKRDKYLDLYEKLQRKGGEGSEIYANQLEKMDNAKSQDEKNRIDFGLQQQPGFRKLYRKSMVD